MPHRVLAVLYGRSAVSASTAAAQARWKGPGNALTIAGALALIIHRVGWQLPGASRDDLRLPFLIFVWVLVVVGGPTVASGGAGSTGRWVARSGVVLLVGAQVGAVRANAVWNAASSRGPRARSAGF